MPSETTTDAEHRAQMRAWLRQGAALMAVRPVGPAVYGWHDRTIGTEAATPDGPRWLRMATEWEEFAQGHTWDGNCSAAALPHQIPRPTLLASRDWAHGRIRLRAELMTIVQAPAVSHTHELRTAVSLPSSWWAGLRQALRTLGTVDTDRRLLTPQEVEDRIARHFGPGDYTVHHWTVAHNDLHWANLTAPGPVLLDWERWGVSPQGFDAATLYVHSQLIPDVAAQVRQTFGDVLADRDGLVSQLWATARLLDRIPQGDHPDLEDPLRRNASRVLRQLQEET